MSYEAEDIKSLTFKEGVRTRVQMYLGSADNEGAYQAFKEIINNATDEALAGYGNKIEIVVSEKENFIAFMCNHTYSLFCSRLWCQQRG